MKARCAAVSDGIWEACRTGVPLDEEVLEHVSSCADCASTIAEARAGLSALECLPRNPVAPDCRSAVWDRVTRRRARPLPSRAYASVVAMVVLTVVGILPQHLGQRPGPQPPQAVVHKPTPRLNNRPEAPVVQAEKPQAGITAGVPKPDPRRHLPVQRLRRSIGSAAVARPQENRVEPTQAPPTEESSMVASVTWSLADRQKDSYQLNYTLTDSATGDTTKCSVKRDGNSIEVTMESEPTDGETDPAPVKETKSNEAHRWS